MTTNRFKLSSQKRTGATDAAFAMPALLDHYETPSSATLALCEFVMWSERGKRNSNRETRVEWASQYGTIQPWH